MIVVLENRGDREVLSYGYDGYLFFFEKGKPKPVPEDAAKHLLWHLGRHGLEIVQDGEVSAEVQAELSEAEQGDGDSSVAEEAKPRRRKVLRGSIEE